MRLATRLELPQSNDFAPCSVKPILAAPLTGGKLFGAKLVRPQHTWSKWDRTTYASASGPRVHASGHRNRYMAVIFFALLFPPRASNFTCPMVRTNFTPVPRVTRMNLGTLGLTVL